MHFFFYAVSLQTITSAFKIRAEVYRVWLLHIQPGVLFILNMHHVSLAKFEMDVATYLSLDGYFMYLWL